jgi:cytoskeletal protein CcmA (bactofilin family)
MSLRGKGPTGELNGFLDKGSHLKGELHFDQTFRVDGKVTGKIVSEGDLVVGTRGEIEGEVSVGRAFVSGTVRGRLRATRRLEISSGGRVYADLETPSLVIEDGAQFEGSCAMERGTPAAEPAPAESGRITRLSAVKER